MNTDTQLRQIEEAKQISAKASQQVRIKLTRSAYIVNSIIKKKQNEAELHSSLKWVEHIDKPGWFTVTPYTNNHNKTNKYDTIEPPHLRKGRVWLSLRPL